MTAKKNVTQDHVNASWITLEIRDSNFTFQRTDVEERLTARQKKSELYFTLIFTKLLDYTSNWTNSLCVIDWSNFCLFFHKKQLIDYEAVSGFIDNLGQPVLYGVFTSEFVFKADLFKKRVHSTECLGSKQSLTFTKFKLKPIFVSFNLLPKWERKQKGMAVANWTMLSLKTNNLQENRFALSQRLNVGNFQT